MKTVTWEITMFDGGEEVGTFDVEYQAGKTVSVGDSLDGFTVVTAIIEMGDLDTPCPVASVEVDYE